MKRLRALMVEDRQDDTDLLILALERAGYTVDYVRVCSAEAMRAELVSGRWDIVFSDYSMPVFSALGALRVHHESGLDLPFIIISGTIGEATAVDALKAGAHDFLMKGQLARLAPAVERELREAEIRAARRRADEALRESEARFRALMEALPDPVLVHQDLKLVYVNPAAVRLLGYDGDAALIGSSPLDILHEEDRAVVRERISRMILGESVGPSGDLRWRRADGRIVIVVVNGQKMMLGGRLAMMAVAHDVTEQRKMEAQLLVSDRMASIGTLAAGVAHEINNPLAVVIANLPFIRSELKDRGPTGSTELDEALQETEEAAQRVKQIVMDLKLFSRGTDAAAIEPVNLAKVLETSARMARNEIRHRARLVTRFGAVPDVLGNEARLGQVFLNLVVNAAQAIPEGNRDQNEIRLITSLHPDGRVIAEVQDTGPGIPRDVLDKLFSPFFTTKPAGIGTGLGLSICQRIITSLKGELEVTSEVGVGTTFRVILPAAEAPRAAAQPAATVIEAPIRRGKVLVIDDEVMIGKAVQRALSAHHDVTAVASGAEALRLLDSGQRYGLILCDLMMPHMTGMELHAVLRERHPEHAQRMVFLSGGAFTEATRHFIETVANERIEKPFDVFQLANFVITRINQLND